MSRSKQQVLIQAPLPEVWELVGDPNRHPEWWPRVMEVECQDLAEGCTFREVMRGPFGVEEHELLIERLDNCREVTIHCREVGTTTRFVLTEAQGGTFVDAEFRVEPATASVRVFDMLAGRRYMRRWLEASLDSLKQACAPVAAD